MNSDVYPSPAPVADEGLGRSTMLSYLNAFNEELNPSAQQTQNCVVLELTNTMEQMPSTLHFQAH